MDRRKHGGRGGKPPPPPDGNKQRRGGKPATPQAPAGAKPAATRPLTGAKPAGPRTLAGAKPAPVKTASVNAAPQGPGTRPRPAPRESGLWLYGHHPVLAALENPDRRCLRLMITAQDADALGPRLTRALAARGLEYESVSREMIERVLPPASVHQGVALKIEPLEELALDEACARDIDERAIVVVLDQVTDPHNVGAIMRSAAAFGAKAVVVTDRHAPGATAVMAKAASGALDVIPLVRVVNLARALDELGELGYWRVALDADTAQTLADTDTTGSVALVLGAEGVGLRRLTKERCDAIAKLPIGGGIESLNVSNAAAVALYELVRGR
ncbi:23S rRNA (guanosine(2251)-2'-O)-methyltransferase RlmB [Oleomonas cavernae]|uniref:23S rRNA (Guanosine(2251)-2'-O)-methyltransferase RlmB n=1 Tax=Oleomonas cavernae TaxID=2320859 RepID=A0A418WEJ5_9PROT|nr:23S rRNA (guanosine(2251)-2'-O)-methyltransferase RlmB [Oleomonas cavernae]RJF88416.1 23S rRNA (guanosine(2251)-2'-O)-methyltransferase RlmB [Oleomonas cavernae]